MVGVGGRIAGRYTLRELFKLGGEGMAWRATDDDLGRDVVLKCPRPDDPDSAQRLRTAARNAAALRHQHIIGVYNIFEHDDVCWLVTEYVPGYSLAEVAREQRKLGPARAAIVGEQIASALAHCHDRGILHCDISPENIILADDGDAWLTDFGSSLDLRNAGTGDTPDIARGKWRYLAPEVAAGGPAGPKSDVYALAATLLAVTERQRRPGPFEALLTQLTLPNPIHRPTAATAATRFARLDQTPRGWDRTLVRRAAVGAAEVSRDGADHRGQCGDARCRGAGPHPRSAGGRPVRAARPGRTGRIRSYRSVHRWRQLRVGRSSTPSDEKCCGRADARRSDPAGRHDIAAPILLRYMKFLLSH